MKRIHYIDGIKGIACLGVFFHHLIIQILPAAYTGLKSESILPGDYLLGGSPLGILINGNFWVCMFIMISSFLLAKQTFAYADDRRKMSELILKRYPRLMLPVLCVNLLCLAVYYILSKGIGLEISNPLEASVLGCLKMSLFDIWFTEDVTVMGYWMMNILFIGSFISVLLSAAINGCKKFKILLSLAIGCVLTLINTYFLAVVLGVVLELVSQNEFLDKFCKIKFSKIITVLIVIIAVILGGYPSSGNLGNIYSAFSLLPSILSNSSQIFHTIGAFLLLILPKLCGGGVQR